MGKGTIVIGDPKANPSAGNTAESVAFEYFVNRTTAGGYAPRPPIEQWSADQRERFLAELRRLDDERAAQSELAVQQANERT
jgi:hypothetical protein